MVSGKNECCDIVPARTVVEVLLTFALVEMLSAWRLVSTGVRKEGRERDRESERENRETESECV